MELQDAYKLADALYAKGYDDRTRERDCDPRGTAEWQAVVDALTRHPTGEGRSSKFVVADPTEGNSRSDRFHKVAITPPMTHCPKCGRDFSGAKPHQMFACEHGRDECPAASKVR